MRDLVGHDYTVGYPIDGRVERLLIGFSDEES
jgi:hypothetical protein